MWPYITSFVVPTGFLVLGAFGKRLVRATHWEWEDWYLGVEFVLAAISGSVIHGFDLHKNLQKVPKDLANYADQALAISNQQNVNYLFMTTCLLCFFFIVTVHQKWEPRDDERRKYWMLAGVSNFIGYALLAAFMLVVKGVD